MWEDLAQYIINNYANANKIVEVGVGNFHKVALTLKENLNSSIVMTDIKSISKEVIQDDISNPDLKIYEGSSLIYSIRPQPELQPHIIKLAENIGADVIIKPFSTEFINSNKMKLVNYKKATFYKISSK
ncbi:MAG: hypothetical protein HZC47_11145 [Methanobacterium sp.]|uniref:UPF0146 family protein n=1 Tax=Methanobacterium sp. TaxID=2164 RepID=UPI003D65C78F|nr:hypothetical protein [Methanobacterium sp.]